MSKCKEARRALLQRLQDTRMTPGQDPDEYFLNASLIRIDLEDMGEYVTNETYEDILVRGFTADYDSMKLAIYRDPSYTVDQIQHTMRSFFPDEVSRTADSGKSGRGSAMTVGVTCYH